MRKFSLLALLSIAGLAVFSVPTNTLAESDKRVPSMLDDPNEVLDEKKEEKRDSAESLSQTREVRAAFEGIEKTDRAMAKIREATAELLKGVDRKTPEGIAEIRAAYDMQREMQKPLRKLAEKRTEAFLDAFSKTEVKQWYGSEDQKILEKGLLGLARRSASDEPAKAVELYETFVAKVKDSRMSGSVYNRLLPKALIATGDYEKAKARMAELAADATSDKIIDFAIHMGDLEALHGKTDEALKIWTSALETIPEDVEKRDHRYGQRNYLRVRANNVGKTATEIDSKVWLGGKAQPLSKMKGKIVVLDFWATWCGPCIAGMPAMDDLAKKYKEKGVEVLGVTRYYKRGYLATGMEELRKGERNGTRASEMDEEAFMKHLKQFRANTKPSYPFVVGAPDVFKSYHISGIPTFAVVDTEGKVAYITVGNSKAELKLVLDRLLAKK